MRACKKCGAEIERGDMYCPECGEKISEEVRTVTVWSIVKAVIIIFFFAMLGHVLKEKQVALSVIFFFFLIIFILWANILNWFLKKVFNAEVSRGVKIVVTVVLVVILLLGTNLQSSTMKPVKVEQRLEDAYFSDFMLRLNNVIGSKDYGSLKQMLEEGVIAREVFDDISSLMGNVLSKEDFTVYLKPQNQQFYENKAKVDTSVIIKSRGVEKASGVVCLFEKSERGWMLSAITPKLTDIKLSRSFEEEAEYKLKQTPKPADKLLEDASAIASQKEAYIKKYLKG